MRLKNKMLEIKKKRVAIIVYDGVEVLDVTGPCSVFSKANDLTSTGYEICIISEKKGLIKTNSGISLYANASWKTIDPTTIDTLIVAGGHERTVINYFKDSALLAWMNGIRGCARRVVSVCTGAFALGYAGLLQGCTVTTHWSVCDLLQKEFPDAHVSTDKLYVQDKNIWSSAGILAGIELALALVEDDLGKDIAINIANLLVLAGLRPETPLQNQSVSDCIMKELLSWIQFNFTSDCSVDVLAHRVGLSERHLCRLFRKETGLSPAKYVSMVRLNHVEYLLKNTNWSIHRIVEHSGFDTINTLRRSFIHRRGVTPGKYRQVERNKLIK